MEASVKLGRIDSTRRRMKIPLPLPGAERLIYSAVILVLTCGALQSVQFNDWELFERSGSLVIIIAITLAWRDYVSLLGDVRKFYSNEFEKRIRTIDSTLPRGFGALPNGRLQTMLEIRQKTTESLSEIDQLIQILRKRLRTTEIAILILGTVISGYGSVVGQFLWNFP
jgi:hypothetical protein